MKDLLYKICSAIARQEGGGPSALNPGNLRSAPWLPSPVIQNGFWKPTSRAQGIAGMYHQVALDISRGATLRKLISKWAPPAENQTEAYIKNVKSWTGILDENQPLQELLELDLTINPGAIS